MIQSIHLSLTPEETQALISALSDTIENALDFIGDDGADAYTPEETQELILIDKLNYRLHNLIHPDKHLVYNDQGRDTIAGAIKRQLTDYPHNPKE